MNRWIAGIAAHLMAASCAVAALYTGWVNFSMRAVVPGRKFVIGELVSGGGRAMLCSYGFAVALLCVVALVAYRRNRPGLLGWTSAGLLLLAFGAFLQVAFANSALLHNLLSDHQQYRDAQRFSKKNLPTDLGVIPTKQETLSGDTVWNRMVAAQFFMGFGWT